MRLLSTKATSDLDLVFRDENLQYFRSKHMQVKRNDKHFRFNVTCNNKVTKREREICLKKEESQALAWM